MFAGCYGREGKGRVAGRVFCLYTGPGWLTAWRCRVNEALLNAEALIPTTLLTPSILPSISLVPFRSTGGRVSSDRRGAAHQNTWCHPAAAAAALQVRAEPGCPLQELTGCNTHSIFSASEGCHNIQYVCYKNIVDGYCITLIQL